MRARFVAEVQEQHAAQMGAELGALFTALYEEVLSLHIKIAEYRVLYSTKRERVDILNEAAGSFFVMVS